MISMYQKPQISFKVSSCNFVYFFSTVQQKTPKPTKSKPPNKQTKIKKQQQKKPHTPA